MRKRKLVIFLNWFWCMVVGFLMLCSPFAGKAQNNSVVDLAETAWKTDPVVIPTSNIDNSVTILTRYYYFDKQGKIKFIAIKDKSAGVEDKLVYDYVYDYVWVGGTNGYEYRWVYKYVHKQVITKPELNSETLIGTYEINGKSIHLDFPDHTIRATIYSGSMKGVLTYKSTSNKEEWMTRKMSGNNNAPDKQKDVKQNDIPQKAKESYRRLSEAEASKILRETLELLSNRQYTECLPKKGILRMKMKDGSIRKQQFSIRSESKGLSGSPILEPFFKSLIVQALAKSNFRIENC